MNLIAPTLDEQIAEVERELELRRRFYPERVREKKMSQRKADTQLERLKAALKTLRTVRSLEE